jgi:hypothetical protein
MEKLGVSDAKELQKKELKQVKTQLGTLNSSLEKTADQTQETERLEKRAVELQIEIAEQ